MNHANGAVRASGTNAPAVPDRLLALTTEALAFVSRDRAEGMARQWLAGVPLSSSNEQSVLARSLALELALSVPSLKGTTAFDRLARAMKGRPPEDAAAVMLLRRSRLRYRGLSARGSKIWRPARHCPCCLLRPQTPWVISAPVRRPVSASNTGLGSSGISTRLRRSDCSNVVYHGAELIVGDVIEGRTLLCVRGSFTRFG